MYQRVGSICHLVIKLGSGEARPDDIEKLPSQAKNIPVYGGNGITGYTASEV